MSLNLPASVQQNIGQFTGRTWLLSKVLDWYTGSQERILLLTGGPGTGKTMILAWLAGFGPLPDEPIARQQLVQIRAQVKAAHFCIAASGATAPKALAQNLAEQLTRNVPGFADALKASLAELVRIEGVAKAETVMAGATLTGVQIGTLNLTGLSEELSFNRTLREPLQKLYENGYDKPLLLLVDALDEALTYTGTIDIVRLLAKLDDLPGPVRFLVSTRPDPRVLKHLRQAKLVDLIDDAPAGEDDVRTYVDGRLNALEDERRTAVAERLSRAAAGNFLYARLVLDDLVPRLPSISDLETLPLPEGLGGLYADFMNRELGADEGSWYEEFEPVLGLIAVAQGEGLSQAQIEHIIGQDARRTLRVCKQYLEGPLPDGPFRCFHRSFVNWLLEDQENVDYHIDGAQMHRQIADHYWEAHHPGWQGCDAYGLHSLAIHLYHGGQQGRLQMLINQAWMAARVEGGGYTYDGFLDDLMLAWQQAHEETQRQIRADQAPAAMAECVRCALLRTSINSLAGNYQAELVARAVEISLWPPERALSVARRVPDSKDQAWMLASLLAASQLYPEQNTQAQEAGLEAALAIGDEQDRAEVLAILAPQLTGETLARGLEAALAIGHDRFRAKALAALAPQLTGEALVRGLEAALAIGDKWSRAEGLAALAPQLAGEALARGLEAALVIGDEWSRAKALAALAPRLTGKMRSQALAQGLEAALVIGDEWFRAEALVALAPQLTGEALARGLEAALAIGDEWSRAKALAALAPQLTGEARSQALARGLEAALAIGNKWSRAEALAALALHLTGEARSQALAQGLEAAVAIGDEQDRAEVLAILAPQLTGETLARGLEAALAIEHERFRARALAALAPQLTGKARNQALAQGLEAALAIGHAGSRSEVLALLAPQLTGEARNQALTQGLEAALAIWDEESQAQALAILAPQLTGEARSQALVRGLEVALTIGDEWFRAEALAALAPHLTGEALVRGLEAALAIGDEWSRAKALAALAPQLTGEARSQALERGLEAALAIGDEGSRVKALAALAPQLTSEARSQALARGLGAALAIGDEGSRSEALAALAPQLTGETLARGLEAALAIGQEGSRSEALTALAPQLTGKARNQALAQGLEAALAIGHAGSRAEALALLAPQLTGEARSQALAQGLEAALAIWDEESQAQALALLAPQLTGEARSQALVRGLEAALAIGDEWFRAEALAALAPHLTGEARSQALVRGLEAALAIGDEGSRAEALVAFLPVVSDPLTVLCRAREAIADHLLDNLSTAKREEVLQFCTNQKLFTPPILDQATLTAIAEHIVEVCRQWQWM